MSERNWQARTKQDLIIEVWEYLDCESVGAKELAAIEAVVRERYGAGALLSPAATARLLADEGAELRHAEVLAYDVEWRSLDPYEAMFRNLLKFTDFAQTLKSLKQIESLRNEFERRKDKDGARRLRELALKGKQRAQMIAANPKVEPRKRAEKKEIAEWFGIWLTNPAIAFDWIALRQQSAEFKLTFADGNAQFAGDP